MERQELIQWLIDTKQFQLKSARDVASRFARVRKLLGAQSVDKDDSLARLTNSPGYRESNIQMREVWRFQPKEKRKNTK